MNTRLFSTVSSFLLLILVLGQIPVALAIPARRAPETIPHTEFCESQTSRQKFVFGPGRRPGATAVFVQLRQQVQNAEGAYVLASSGYTDAVVRGDVIRIRMLLRNASIYDVGRVKVRHSFASSQRDLLLRTVSSVSGADYDDRTGTFEVDAIPHGETVTVSFNLVLSENVDSGLSQSKLELEDFIVLDKDRRYPEATPESNNTTQTIARIGIGGTAVSCFTGESVARRSTTGGSISYGTGGGDSSAGTIRVQKRVSPTEAAPGSQIHYDVLVSNGGSPIKNIRVDERLNADQQTVIDAAGSQPTGFGLRWVIPELGANENWMVSYSTRLTNNLAPGAVIPSVVSIFAEDIKDVSRTQLRASTEVVVPGGAPSSYTPSTERPYSVVMPQTGWESTAFLFLVLQVVLGILIAGGMYGTGLRYVWKKI